VVTLYNLFQHLFLVLLFPFWAGLLIVNKRYRKGLIERLGFSEVFEDGIKGLSIWMHAASLGEVKVSAPICEELAQKFPTYEIVFSSTTHVGKKQARSLLKGIKKVFLLPLDFLWVVCPIVSRFHPRFLLVAETELWPNLFFCMRKKRAHIALFNGRISDRSFKRYSMFRFFFKRVLSCIDLFCMQTAVDAQRIQALGASKESVHITGNVKFDDPYTPLKLSELQGLREELHINENDPVWVAGSVHTEEFFPLFEAYRRLKEANPRSKWILVPRHLYALGQFKDSLNSRGVSWALWDGKGKVSKPWEVLLVNVQGQLVRLYQLGFAAFVGGSLAPVGGHNPLEPLRYGIPTLFGPWMGNFKEIRDIATGESVAFEVANAGEVAAFLRQFLEEPERKEEIRIRCEEFFEKYRGATQRSIQLLENWIRENA